MANEPDGAAAGAVPGNDPAAGQGGQGGEGGAPGGAKPGAEGEGQFNRADLHPALRDLSPQQITSLFEDMATTIRRTDRSSRGDDDGDVSGIPAHARPAPKREIPKAPDRDVLKEMFNPESDKFDPEGAVKAIAQANYGQLFADINIRSIRGLYGNFRAQLPDFADYEQEVTETLTKSGRDPSTITDHDVLNTYFAVKGMRQTMKERQARQAKGTTTVPPTPDPDKEKKKEEPLDDLETEVARRMFRNSSDPVKAYRENKQKVFEGVEMKVPVGDGKKE